jgi:hypothetical protein
MGQAKNEPLIDRYAANLHRKRMKNNHFAKKQISTNKNVRNVELRSLGTAINYARGIADYGGQADAAINDGGYKPWRL